jgi:hypothetical protein
MMMIDPVDMIGDTLHAGIQICPHVYKRCNNVATVQAAVKALDVIGLPGREIKVQTGKGNNPIKADVPALNGPEVSKVVEGRGAVLDAVLSPSDPGAAKAYKVWEAYDCMSAAWSAYHGEGSSTSTTHSRGGIFSAFLNVAPAADVTSYMHFVVWHFPTWMEAHGCIDRYSAQCMEHANMEVKQGYRQGSNHQGQRVTCTGKAHAEQDWASSQAQHFDGASPRHAWTRPPCPTTHAQAEGRCSQVGTRGEGRKAQQKK